MTIRKEPSSWSLEREGDDVIIEIPAGEGMSSQLRKKLKASLAPFIGQNNTPELRAKVEKAIGEILEGSLDERVDPDQGVR